ncbi:MAG TPA: VanZ family protein [Thermoanaerobaculia bacterium]|jgi:VanZ family protein|nr:VanZ family protein [Thermoanaerobaculia bacterium]
MRQTLNYWLPPILWSAVVMSASTDLFSGANTGSVLGHVVVWLLGHSVLPSTLDTMNFVIRKSAHLTEYGIFSALTFRALRGQQESWKPRWAGGAILLAACLASIDEIHQTFVPSRTGTWHDVVLDAAGATVAQILIRVAQVLLFRAS